MEAPLSDLQKAKLCSIVLLGCDRATACKYFGISESRLQAEMDADVEFARDLLRAEAEAAVRHMSNVHRASQVEKNWRTSVWWLERRARGENEEAEVGGLSPEVCAALERFADLTVAEITDRERRESLRRRLLQLAGLRPETTA